MLLLLVVGIVAVFVVRFAQFVCPKGNLSGCVLPPRVCVCGVGGVCSACLSINYAFLRPEHKGLPLPLPMSNIWCQHFRVIGDAHSIWLPPQSASRSWKF